MNEAIFKYEIQIQNAFAIRMPVGAEVVAVQTQKGTPYLWCRVDQDAPTETRHFRLKGTGHSFNGTEGRHIGTFQIEDGALVFHLFEVIGRHRGARRHVKRDVRR